MLILANAALPGRVAVATVDHQLRAESADEAAMVAAVCVELGVPHATLVVDVGRGNMQSEAREARYAALGQWTAREGLSALATAHHADDQAETFLMRANRASGLAGLAGIRPNGSAPRVSVPVLRPLLDWRRAELAQVVASARLTPALDPSNDDEHYDRVRMRKALQDADWLDKGALARSAGNLADAEDALAGLVDATWAELAEVGDEEIRLVSPGNRYLRLACTARAIESLGRPARGEALARLVARLEQGQGGNVGGVQAIVQRDGTWVFSPEVPRKV